MQRNRRSRLLINEFQAKLLWRFAAYWLFYQFTLWNFLFCWRLVVEGPGNPLEQYGRFCATNYPMLIVLALVVPFFAWDAAKFSHRVAGPIYRVQQTMRAIMDRQPVRPITLRNGDQLTEFVDDFNALLEVLEQRGAALIDRPGGASFASEADCDNDDIVSIDTVQ